VDYECVALLRFPCRRKSNKPKAFQPTYGSFSKTGGGHDIETPKGDGDELQNIPIIKQRLDALDQDAAELKFLHSVIFGSEGEGKSRKQMLMLFKGLSGGSSASTDAVCATTRLQPDAQHGEQSSMPDLTASMNLLLLVSMS
jgi:hypothetical protein